MPLKQPGWRIYKEQMSQLDHGDALWEPAPIHSFKRIQLGDVGYLRRGRFHLLFSAGRPLGERRSGVNVPSTFEPLSVGPVVYGQPRLPGYLCTRAVRKTGAGLATSTGAIPTLEPGVRISFQLTEKKGGALTTKHRTYREDVELESIFKAYTKRHYDSWVAFARDAGHGDNIKPVLVTGVDMTQDFAMMAYLNNDDGISSDGGSLPRSEFTTSASIVPSTWGTWRTEGSVHTNCGPQTCYPPSSTQTADLTPSDENDTETIPDGYNQCVFVRYYTMRKKLLVFPTVIRAAAGPHDLGSGHCDDEELTRMETRSNSDTDTDSGPDSGSDSGSDTTPDSWDEYGEDNGILATDEDVHIVIPGMTSTAPSPRLPGRSVHLWNKEDGSDTWAKEDGSDARHKGDSDAWDEGDSDAMWDESDSDTWDESDGEGNDFDTIADYIFQNSNAESALIHHRDIAELRESGGTSDTTTALLLEKRPPVRVDEDRVGTLGRRCLYRTDLNNHLQVNGSAGRLRWGNPIKEGPDDRPSWTIQAFLDGEDYGRGTGRTLRLAKEEAVRGVLRRLLASSFLH